MSGAYDIRPFEAGDEVSLLETYNRVFGAERTLAEWSWAFERNPAGRRIFVAVTDGRVVAQYAALATRMLIEGEAHTGLHVIDSMVDPEHRSGARQPGLFVLTALAFFREYGAPDRDPIHFGWPVERAWRVGRRLLDYEIVRAQNAMVLDLAEAPVRNGAAGTDAARAPAPDGPPTIHEIQRFGPGFDVLGRRCAKDVGATVLRDADHLNWRFADHPRHTYHALAAGAVSAPDGLAVWRPADLGVPNLAVLAEWLVPTGATEVAEALLGAVIAGARDAGLATLALWCPEWSPWCAWLQERGFRVQPTDYLTTARSWSRRHDPVWLRDHWWYQLSDTDLV